MSGTRPVDPGARLRELLDGDDPLTWVTAGDSVAQGARWTDGRRDYVQLLEERVRYELGRSGDVFARTAVSGWRAADVLGGAHRIDQLRPAIVLLGLGINDAKLGPSHLPEFTQTYQAVIDHLQATGALVLAQLPNTVRPSARVEVARFLPDYVDAMREVGRRSKAVVVDHFQVWSECAGRWAPAAWMADGEHPDGTGHRVLARTLFEACGIWDDASECCALTAIESAADPASP